MAPYIKTLRRNHQNNYKTIENLKLTAILIKTKDFSINPKMDLGCSAFNIKPAKLFFRVNGSVQACQKRNKGSKIFMP